MATYNFVPTHYYNIIGDFDPVLEIAPGDTVITTALDAHGLDADNKQAAQSPNPLTGPFYIDGSEPGDTIAVHLDHIYPNRTEAWSSTCITDNVVDPSLLKMLPENGHGDWEINLDQKIITLLRPEIGAEKFRVPLSPMLGCIGVAPPAKQAFSTLTSAQHGGNMDYRWISEGATLYLPVFVKGALLFLGDGHASQGDGEIGGTGIEVSFDVHFTVHLLKEKLILWPRGENKNYIFTLGNTRPLEQALQHATTEMIRWLRDDYNLDIVASSIIMSQYVEYDIGNIYNPAYTVVCKIPKNIIQIRQV